MERRPWRYGHKRGSRGGRRDGRLFLALIGGVNGVGLQENWGQKVV